MSNQDAPQTVTTEQSWLGLPTAREEIALLRIAVEVSEPVPLSAESCEKARAVIADLRGRGHLLFAWDDRIWYPEHPDITSLVLAELVSLREPLLAVLEREPPEGLDVPALFSGLAAESEGELSDQMLTHFGLNRGVDWDYFLSDAGKMAPALTPTGVERLKAVLAKREISVRVVDRRGGEDE